MDRASSKKLYVVSLGCPKNLVDTEHMLGLLAQQGYSVSNTAEGADLALVNTCGFIQDAVTESIDTILDLARIRMQGHLRRLVVTGCFVQRYGYKLKKEIPEVDLWLGTGKVEAIVEHLENLNGGVYLDKPVHLADPNCPRLRCTPFYMAYLKIAEGCSHRCSFCMIPKLRGPLRSRTLDSLMAEAERLAADGVRELNIVAQDITSYGADLGLSWGLERLVEGLSAIKGIKWIRLLYGHPNGISERLLDIINTVDKVCPYLDIPFQHVNESVLSAMGRKPSEPPRRLVERIRRRNRYIAIRTTLMVGFPGEGVQEFKELKEFVNWAQLDYLGVFTYSREKGTRAARLKNAVDKEVAMGRRREIMEIQAEISYAKNRQKIGKILPVLMEGLSEETDLLLRGRTQQMAPEIDGQVLVNRGEAMEGEIMDVRITDAYHYDLIGEVVE